MKNDLNILLQKEMDRTDFLKHVGIALLALSGAGAIVKALTGFGNHNVVTNGFGSGAYGGGRTNDTSH